MSDHTCTVSYLLGCTILFALLFLAPRFLNGVLIPGLGTKAILLPTHESFGIPKNLMQYPHYTRDLDWSTPVSIRKHMFPHS